MDKRLLAVGAAIFGVIILRNWAQQTPTVKGDDLLLQLPPIPIKNDVQGMLNGLRLAFGSSVNFNSATQQWEMITPPLVISKEALGSLPDLAKQLFSSNIQNLLTSAQG